MTQPRPACSLFVWGTWAVMLAAAVVFVWSYGSNVPSWDAWDMVPTVTGNQPVTLSWLWSQHNEHRVPIPRLVLLGLCWLTGCDLRAGMYFGVLALGALALAMIVLARRLRGQPSYSDAFFPLLLLNWGHAVNFLWDWQVQFHLSTVVAGAALLLIARHRYPFRLAAAMATWVALLLLPLCGANGVAVVPALAAWLLCSAIILWRFEHSLTNRDAMVAFGIGASACLVLCLYLLGYEAVPYHPRTRSPIEILKAAIAFLTAGLGPATRSLWPLSGLAALSMLLFASGLLLAAVRYQPDERHRALGLASFLGGMACLALAIGSSRAGFEPRYVTLAAPVWCCVYFASAIYAPRKLDAALRAGLFIVAFAALWPNMQFGAGYGADLRAHLGLFERDMAASVPMYKLINRHASHLHIHQDVLMDYMPMLRRAGVGAFRLMKDDPPFRAVAVSLEPASVSRIKWSAGIAHATGSHAYLVFDLGGDRYVSGIRLKYSYSEAPWLRLYWKQSVQEDFRVEQSWTYVPTGDRANWTRGTWLRATDPETTMTVWVCETLHQLRIQLRRPGILKISEFELLVRDSD